MKKFISKSVCAKKIHFSLEPNARALEAYRS
jgi:hypothetical protein